MTVNTPTEDEGRGLRDRLADIPRDRLGDEVVSRWDDMIRLEGRSLTSDEGLGRQN